MRCRIPWIAGITILCAMLAGHGLAQSSGTPQAEDAKRAAKVIRSAKSGPWSAPDTWEGGKVPSGGSVVQIRTAHTVLYDLQMKDDLPFRAVQVAGTLRFAPDRDTSLWTQLLRIQPG